MNAAEQTIAGSPTVDRADESRLVKAASEGSAEAARNLVAFHWERCYRAAYLILRDHQRAEDVAQECLLRLVTGLAQWRDGSPVAPWLHRVVVNRSLDLLRSERIRPQPAASDPPEVSAEERLDGPDPKLIAALGELGPEDRTAVVMRYVLDYRGAEIGEVLRLPEATVRTRLSRALQRLRTSLEALDGDQ